MQILLSIYCRPDNLHILTNELYKYLDTHNSEQVTVQISTTTYTIQNPEFKLNEPEFYRIKESLKKYNVDILLFRFDYGPTVNTIGYDSHKYDIAIFCNSYIPTHSSINKIIDYFNQPVVKDTFVCQYISNKYNFALGSGIYYATNHNMNSISYFLEYTFASNYEVLFNFDVWLSFYIKLHQYTLIGMEIDSVLLYQQNSTNNCYINNIDRQICNLTNIDFTRYFSNLKSANITKLNNNIYYHPQQQSNNANAMPICNDSAIRKCVSIDNFYIQPLNVYNIALQQSFIYSTKYNIFISHIINNQLTDYFKHVISSLLDVHAEKVNITDHFFAFNCDKCIAKPILNSSWACIVFLNPDASIDNGLTFYTNNSRINKYSEIDVATLNTIDCFIPEDVIGNIFNRVVLFNSSFIYSFPFCKNNIFQYIEFTLCIN